MDRVATTKDSGVAREYATRDHLGEGWGDEDNGDEEAEESEPDVAASEQVGGNASASGAAAAVGAARVMHGAFCQSFAMCCTCCNSSSMEVAWYEEPGVAEDNSIVEIPKGDVCWTCGKASEAFPKMGADVLYKKVRQDPSFRAEFNSARDRAADLPAQPHFKESLVYGQSQCGLRVENECALVDVEDWAAFYQYPPASVVGVTVATMNTDQGDEEHKRALGVLMSLKGLPAELPHRKCTLYADYSNVLTEMVLRHASITREEQAKGTWHILNDVARGGRPQPLRSAGPLTKLLTHQQVAKHKVELKNENLLRHGSGADIGAGSGMAVETKQRRGLQLPSFAAPVSKPAQKAQAARGGVAGAGRMKRARGCTESAGISLDGAASSSIASMSIAPGVATADDASAQCRRALSGQSPVREDQCSG